MGGWIAPDGRFYRAPHRHHLRVAAELRATGGGPSDPWNIRDGWIMIRAHGELVCRPDLAQVQWDTLGDILQGAPDGDYRSNLLASLRMLHELEAGRT
jgi:hypothetical protein